MEHNLQIEFICKVKKKYTFKKFKSPIQNHPFEYGLRIKNIGNNIFPGAVLKNIHIKSKESDLYHSLDKDFSLELLNPNESTEIWLNQMITYTSGIMWVVIDLVPNAAGDTITTHQKDRYYGQTEIYLENNKWKDIFYIQGENELQQARTNSYILILTALTFIHGAFGINKILLALLEIIQLFFLLTADMIGKLL